MDLGLPEHRPPLASRSHEGPYRSPHPGINTTRVAPAGFPGAVFVLGVVWMFWFGLPGGGPIVIMSVLLGGSAIGALLVFAGSRRRAKPTTVLDLREDSQPGREEEPR